MNKINRLVLVAILSLISAQAGNAALVKQEMSLSEVKRNAANSVETVAIDDSKYSDEVKEEPVATEEKSETAPNQSSSDLVAEVKVGDNLSEATTKKSQPQQFLEIADDVPLIEGLKKIEEEDLGFESDSGSIESTSYLCEISFEDVRIFYLKTLPQMGWDMIYSNSDAIGFTRDGSKIEISFSKKSKKRIVKFLISSVL